MFDAIANTFERQRDRGKLESGAKTIRSARPPSRTSSYCGLLACAAAAASSAHRFACSLTRSCSSLRCRAGTTHRYQASPPATIQASAFCGGGQGSRGWWLAAAAAAGGGDAVPLPPRGRRWRHAILTLLPRNEKASASVPLSGRAPAIRGRAPLREKGFSDGVERWAEVPGCRVWPVQGSASSGGLWAPAAGRRQRSGRRQGGPHTSSHGPMNPSDYYYS